jgi:hypothetical protein
MANYHGMNLCIYYLIIFIRKVPYWNGSKNCFIEVSECSKFITENLDGPKADKPLVEQSAAPVILIAADPRQNRKEEEEILQHAEDENKAEEEKQQRQVHRERIELTIFR